jgi:hypothetical protein
VKGIGRLPGRSWGYLVVSGQLPRVLQGTADYRRGFRRCLLHRCEYSCPATVRSQRRFCWAPPRDCRAERLPVVLQHGWIRRCRSLQRRRQFSSPVISCGHVFIRGGALLSHHPPHTAANPPLPLPHIACSVRLLRNVPVHRSAGGAGAEQRAQASS